MEIMLAPLAFVREKEISHGRYDDDLRWEDVGASSLTGGPDKHVVAIGARKVGVVRLDGGLKAFKDQCPHLRNLPLCENGGYQGSVVSCPHHGWGVRFRSRWGWPPVRACEPTQYANVMAAFWSTSKRRTLALSRRTILPQPRRPL